MLGRGRGARVGLAVVVLMTIATGTLFAQEPAQPRGDRPSQPSAPSQPAPPAPTEGAACYERYIPAPVDEKGIQCPGEPAIWKSYTYASSRSLLARGEMMTSFTASARFDLPYRLFERDALAGLDLVDGEHDPGFLFLGHLVVVPVRV
jgi:hypothetical protein